MAPRASKKLESYIERHLDKGFSMSKIKQQLRKSGHSKKSTDLAAKQVLSKRPELYTKFENTNKLVVVGVILIAAVLLLFVSQKTKETVEYVEQVEEAEVESKFQAMSDIELLKHVKATGQAVACNYIEEHNLRYACEDSYWEREDCLYEEFVGEGMAECYYDYAIKTNDTFYCSGSSDEEKCYYELDLKFREPEPIIGADLFLEVENAKSLCESELSDDDSNYGFCYVYNSVNSNDLSSCQNLNTEFQVPQAELLGKDYCELMVIEKRGDSALCNTGRALFDKLCLAVVANNPQACSTINEADRVESFERRNNHEIQRLISQGADIYQEGGVYYENVEGDIEEAGAEENSLATIRETCTAWSSEDQSLCGENVTECLGYFAHKELLN